MNDKLPPEVRVKVAEEITGRPAKADGLHIISGNRHWQPHFVCEQKSALTRTAARLIDEVDKAALESTSDASTPNEKPMRARWGNAAGLIMKYSKADKRFRKAIATNDTDALEGIVAELKGFV